MWRWNNTVFVLIWTKMQVLALWLILYTNPPSGISGGIDVGGALARDENQNTDHSTE